MEKAESCVQDAILCMKARGYCADVLGSAENLHNELITWVPLEGVGRRPFPMYSLDAYYLCGAECVSMCVCVCVFS